MTKSRVLGLLSTLALAFGLVPVFASPALACSCAAELTDAEYSADADVVFVGRVDEIHTTEPMRSTADPATWTFVVDEVFKGEVQAYTEVVSARSGASCGLELKRGRTALVFASYGTGGGLVDVGEDELGASLCGGSRLVARGSPSGLAPGYAPVAMSEPTGDDGSGFPLLGWLSLAAVAGLGAMAVAVWLRLASLVRTSRRSGDAAV